MLLSKKFKGVFAFPVFLIRLFKKTKVDNFIGGAIFGAIISLIINIFTVKIQDTVLKQRALEAVEREMTYHLMEVQNILDAEKRINSASSSSNISIDMDMAKRFSTKVWDNTQIYNYLLEIDPDTAAAIETHYEVNVKGLNRILNENDTLYTKLFEPCKPFYTFINKEKSPSEEYCRVIQVNSISTQSDIAYSLIKDLDKTKQLFHPTKDRLNSFWLKFLLGDKTVNILR